MIFAGLRKIPMKQGKIGLHDIISKKKKKESCRVADIVKKTRVLKSFIGGGGGTLSSVFNFLRF